jgi:hypothetical protein
VSLNEAEFVQVVVTSIRERCPHASIVQEWTTPGERRFVDLVVMMGDRAFVLETKAWTGKISAGRLGTVTIERDGQVFRAPDPRLQLRSSVWPLLHHRNRLANGLTGAPQLWTEAMVVVPDSAVVPEDLASHQIIPILPLAHLLALLERQTQVPSVDLGVALARLEAAWHAGKTQGESPRTNVPLFEVSGRPVTGGEFFGRDFELSRALASLQNGASLAIVGPRRFGKTSLLWELERRLREERRIVHRVDYTFGDDGGSATVLEHLQQGTPDCPVVVLLDEAEFFWRLSPALDEQRIRMLLSERRGQLVAASLHRPRSIRPPDRRLSSLDALFVEVDLKPFGPEALRALLGRAFSGSKLELVVAAAGELLGGHPYLTQQLGYHLLHLPSGTDEEEALARAIDQVSHAVRAMLGTHPSERFSEYLVRNDFVVAELPGEFADEARFLEHAGLFIIDGWRLEPVAPIVGHVIAENLAVTQPGDRQLSAENAVDPLPAFLRLAAETLGSATLAEILDLHGDVRSYLEDADHLRRMLARRGIDSLGQLLKDWLGHRERKRLASALGIASPPADAEAAASAILEALKTRSLKR